MPFCRKLVFQELLLLARATSDFPFEISRPPEKILGWKFDAEVAFYFLFRDMITRTQSILWKWPDIYDLSRFWNPRFWVITTFCILARLRRVLRTISDHFDGIDFFRVIIFPVEEIKCYLSVKFLAQNIFWRPRNPGRENRKLHRHEAKFLEKLFFENVVISCLGSESVVKTVQEE